MAQAQRADSREASPAAAATQARTPGGVRSARTRRPRQAYSPGVMCTPRFEMVRPTPTWGTEGSLHRHDLRLQSCLSCTGQPRGAAWDPAVVRKPCQLALRLRLMEDKPVCSTGQVKPDNAFHQTRPPACQLRWLYCLQLAWSCWQRVLQQRRVRVLQQSSLRLRSIRLVQVVQTTLTRQRLAFLQLPQQVRLLLPCISSCPGLCKPCVIESGCRQQVPSGGYFTCSAMVLYLAVQSGQLCACSSNRALPVLCLVLESCQASCSHMLRPSCCHWGDCFTTEQLPAVHVGTCGGAARPKAPNKAEPPGSGAAHEQARSDSPAPATGECCVLCPRLPCLQGIQAQRHRWPEQAASHQPPGRHCAHGLCCRQRGCKKLTGR